jgi:hypothetical protein
MDYCFNVLTSNSKLRWESNKFGSVVADEKTIL